MYVVQIPWLHATRHTYTCIFVSVAFLTSRIYMYILVYNYVNFVWSVLIAACFVGFS